MANQPQQTSQPLQRRNEGLQQRQSASSPMRDSSGGAFSLMRRVSEDMDRLFGELFGGQPFARGDQETPFFPQLEAHHRGDKLIISADIPGMKKDEVQVELRDNELCISGERRRESEHEEGQVYRSERSYGRFSRTVRLPESAKPDTAAATFENGVLKIEIEAPESERNRSRRIEVREGGGAAH